LHKYISSISSPSYIGIIGIEDVTLEEVDSDGPGTTTSSKELKLEFRPDLSSI